MKRKQPADSQARAMRVAKRQKEAPDHRLHRKRLAEAFVMFRSSVDSAVPFVFVHRGHFQVFVAKLASGLHHAKTELAVCSGKRILVRLLDRTSCPLCAPDQAGFPDHAHREPDMVELVELKTEKQGWWSAVGIAPWDRDEYGFLDALTWHTHMAQSYYPGPPTHESTVYAAVANGVCQTRFVQYALDARLTYKTHFAGCVKNFFLLLAQEPIDERFASFVAKKKKKGQPAIVRRVPLGIVAIVLAFCMGK
jgi:hypothetical protein